MPKLATGQRKLLGQATAFYQQSLKAALPFLECRGLDEAVARKYRLGVVSRPCSGHESYVSRLSIPYLSRSGCVTIRFRCLEEHNCKIAQCPKYLSMRGDKPTLYNTEALFAAGSVIAITEGELDALVITEYAGIPAVGIQGVSAWNEVFARTLNDFDRVLIVGDGDEAGRQMVDRLVDSIPNAIGVSLPDGLDANEVYVQYGADELAYILGTA